MGMGIESHQHWMSNPIIQGSLLIRTISCSQRDNYKRNHPHDLLLTGAGMVGDRGIIEMLAPSSIHLNLKRKGPRFLADPGFEV